MWFLLALTAGGFFTSSGLITRHVLKTGRDSWAFSFFYSATGALVSLLFVLGVWFLKGEFVVPDEPWPWGLMILVGFSIVLHNWLNFRASNFLEASVTGTITKFRLVWILLFGVLILDENFTWWKVIGTLLTMFSGILVVAKFRKPGSTKGIIYAFAATLCFTVGVVAYKILFDFFSVWTLTLFVTFLTPAVLNLIIMPNSITRINKLAKDTGKFVYLACALGALANLAMNGAIMLGEVTKAPAIIEAFLVITLVGEHFILRERSKLILKATAVALAVLGAIIIKLN